MTNMSVRWLAWVVFLLGVELWLLPVAAWEAVAVAVVLTGILGVPVLFILDVILHEGLGLTARPFMGRAERED